MSDSQTSTEHEERGLYVAADPETGGPCVQVRSDDGKIRIIGMGGWEPHGRLEVTLCDGYEKSHKEHVMEDGKWLNKKWLTDEMKEKIMSEVRWEKKDWPTVEKEKGGFRKLLGRVLGR